MNKKLIVMSSGGNLFKYKNQLKKLKDNDNFEVFAFSNSFMFCINELGFYPDYFLFIDPNAAMLSLEHIVKTKQKIKTKILFLNPIHTKQNYSEFIEWYGTTPVGRGNQGGWDRFRKLVSMCKSNDNIETIEIPITTMKYLKKYDVKNTLLHSFDERVKNSKVVVKNTLDDTFNEDKLTAVVLPVLHKMNKNNLYLIGFDCMGGRYFTKLDKYSISRYPEKEEASKSKTDYFLATTANRGMDEAKKSIKMFLPKWSNYIKCTNLVEDKYTYLNKFIDYEPIEEVIK